MFLVLRGGQENCGLLPLFGTFFILIGLLNSIVEFLSLFIHICFLLASPRPTISSNHKAGALLSAFFLIIMLQPTNSTYHFCSACLRLKLNTKFYWTQNDFEPKIFPDPKFFFRPQFFFQIQNFFSQSKFFV